MLKIEIWEDNKILRTKSLEIKKTEFKKYFKLAKEMLKYIKNPKNWWVWLAAPQVGKNIRLIVVSLLKDWEDETYPTIAMYNPEILEFSEEKASTEEGCLSLPEIRWEVFRPKKIKIKYFDEKAKEKILFLDYPSSAIVQHEIDHLDGILFIDKVKKNNIPFF
jgi:peptide deformylase